MPNLDPWVKQNEDMTTNKFENHLLSLRDERQEMIHPNSHPTYNERHQNIIQLIDWALEKYKTAVNTQKMNEQAIIDNIMEELYKKSSYNQKTKNSINDYNSKVSITSSNLLIASFILFGFTVGTFNIS